MKVHAALNDELRDRAAAYVAGTLEGSDRSDFEGHLHDCAACRREVDSVRRVADGLMDAIPEVPPPEGAWLRIRERVRASSVAASSAPAEEEPSRVPGTFAEVLEIWAKQQAQDADMTYVADAGTPWLATAVEGVDVRPLHVDRDAGRVTCVVRMDPGSAYPAHRHAGVEECFVLQGDLHVGDDLHMHAGDYQRAEAGSKHAVQSTDEGCLLLITSSLSDTPG